MSTAAPRPFVRQRWLRWLLIALGALIVVIGFCEVIGWPFLRGPMQRAAASALARPVELGDEFRLRLLGSVRLRSNVVALGIPAGAPLLHDSQGRPQRFMHAEGVTLTLPYSTVFALVRGQRDEPLRVRLLNVARLELGLARTSAGVANWQFGAPKTPPAERPELPRFDRLVVHDGRLRLDDAATQLIVDATLRTHEGSAAGNEPAGLELTAVGRYRQSPVQARFRSSGVLPLAAAVEAGSTSTVPLQLEVRAGDARLTLDGRGGDLLNLSALDAQLKLDGPSLGAIGDAVGLTLPKTSPFELRGRLHKAGPVWNADVETLTLGSSRLQGQFAYDPQPAVPTLTGRLGGKRLALGDLGEAFGGGDAKPATPTPGRVLPQQAFNLPSLAAMNADVTVQLDQVSLGTPQLDTLAPLNGRVRLQDQILSVDNLVARASGGELRGALSLDARQKLPRWQADLRWSGVRLEQLVRARNPSADAKQAAQAAPTKAEAAKPKAAKVAARTAYISGALGGRAQLRGTGRSTAAMLASLDGSTELWIRDGRVSSLLTELSGIDLAESLGVVISGDDGLALRCGVARLIVKDGVLTPEVAVLDTSDSTLLVGGRVSLADERLELVLTSRPHDFSPLALRSPVRIEGSFEKPAVSVDAGKIGLRIAAAVALAAVTPLASLLALADVGETERAVCSDALKRLRSSEAPKRPSR